MAKASLHILPDQTKLVVDLQIKGDQDWRFHFSEIKKEKGEFILKEKIENLDADSFKANANSIYPIYLFISGKGLLTKAMKEEANENRIFEFLLPGAKRKDFFLEKFKENEENLYSIVRNDLLEEVFQFFQSNKYRVVNFSINPGVLTAFSRIDERLDSVSNGFFKLDFVNGSLKNISAIKNEGHVPFGKQMISVLNSSSLALFLQEELGNAINGESELVQESVKEEKFKTWMQYGIAASVTFLFALMLINYFAFDYYAQKQDELNNYYAIKKSSILEIDRLKEDISKKKSLVEYAGIDQYHNYAFYADQIANSIPNQISLTQMFLSPIDGGLKPKKKAKHTRDLIWIKGQINQEEYFDAWVENLKDLDCCKKVRINEFSYNTKKRTNEFYLSIEV